MDQKMNVPRIVGLWFVLIPAAVIGQSKSSSTSFETKATGSFEVSVKPLESYNSAKEAMTGRMSLDKTFHGDLAGTSKGEMLTAMTESVGSAGYVAIERVTGTLNGRKRSFSLQHTGTMTRGVPSLAISVVPDSGTDALAGLEGTMTIKIDGKQHFYSFEYTLPERH